MVRDDRGLRTLSQDPGNRRPHESSIRASDFEDVALTTAAGAVAAAALARTESRGCHHRADYPDTDPAMARSLVPAVACCLMELNADELTEARQGDRPCPRRGPAVRTRCHHAGDGAAPMRRRRHRWSSGSRASSPVSTSRCSCSTKCSALADTCVKHRVEDGARLEAGGVVLAVEAPTQGLLTAERTMLNLVCHLSGIATTTAAWVAAVEGTDAKIRDTRKTLPGLRALQKYAVRVGGGVNHRMGLGDAALIKDNHVAAAGSVVAALRAVRAAAPDLPCEVEVDSLEQLDEVLAENLTSEHSCCSTTSRSGRRRSRCSAATLRPPATKLESSGGLSLDTAAEYAGTGVDYLAVGALTHSVTVLDIGLDL